MACNSFTATDDHPNKCTCGAWLSAHIDTSASDDDGGGDGDGDD
jgi:hypothetical protein